MISALRPVFALAALPAFLAACGGGPPPPAPAPPPRPAAIVHRDTVPFDGDAGALHTRAAALSYALANHPFPLPILRGTVQGLATSVLVDTGANAHVIAGWLARRAGLTLKRVGDVSSDHAGRAVETYRVDGARIVLEGWGPLPLGTLLVADVPEAVERMGIGVFLSPQHLADEGHVVVLDLERGALHERTREEAERDVAGRGLPIATHGVRPCIDEVSAIHGLAFILPTLIEGFSAQMLLDTGGLHTDLLASSRLGRGLEARTAPSHERLYSASGKIKKSTVPGAHVRLGDVAVYEDLDVIEGAEDPECPRDGVVGMDILRRCVLVLSTKEAFGRCDVPPEP